MNIPKELTIVTPLSKALALIAFVTMPIIGFFFGMQYQEMVDFVTYHEEQLMLEAQKPTPTPDEQMKGVTFTEENFSKRLFNKNEKFFLELQNYPTELTAINENNLVGIQCTQQYQYEYTGFYYFYDSAEKKDVRLTDNSFIELIKNSNNIHNQGDATNIILCKTENNKYIAINEVHGGGGGSKNIAYFGLAHADKKFNLITSIPNDGAAYFSCYKPLQLTNDNKLYVQCGGGDGPADSSSIYKINLSTYNQILIFKCTALGDNITCK